MILIGWFLVAVSRVLDVVTNVFVFLLVARAILSWVNPDPMNPIVLFIHGSTEPILARVRRYVRPLGMFDLSVWIAILFLLFINTFLVGALGEYGQRSLLAARGAM